MQKECPCDPALRRPAKSMGKAHADGPGLKSRARAREIVLTSCVNLFEFELTLLCESGPEKVPEMRVLEVLRENNMNSNSAFEILELEFQRESWRDTSRVCHLVCNHCREFPVNF